MYMYGKKVYDEGEMGNTSRPCPKHVCTVVLATTTMDPAIVATAISVHPPGTSQIAITEGTAS